MAENFRHGDAVVQHEASAGIWQKKIPRQPIVSIIQRHNKRREICRSLRRIALEKWVTLRPPGNSKTNRFRALRTRRQGRDADRHQDFAMI